MPFKLVIGNKAYSSWSFRPWILLAHFKIPFEEIVIPLDQNATSTDILKYSASGTVPCLIDGKLHIWETLAIIEYIAEMRPAKAIWPRARSARALARVLACEMHAGFHALRGECPMNLRRAPKPPLKPLSAAALADIARIEAAFANARRRFGKSGPFLFGRFCAADAMFAPVVNRLHAYGIEVHADTRAYMDAMMALPAWQAWAKDAEQESWRIEKYENF